MVSIGARGTLLWDNVHILLPSPTVHIENQLLEEQCSQTTFDFTAPFTRCAFGIFSLRNINIVTGVEFTNSTTPEAFATTINGVMNTTPAASTTIITSKEVTGKSTKTIGTYATSSIAIALVVFSMKLY